MLQRREDKIGNWGREESKEEEKRKEKKRKDEDYPRKCTSED
jgi:hypothetical protein